MITTASANPFTATSPFNGRLSRAIPASERMIIKRDGSSRPFDLQKIIRAIALAYHEVANGVGANPHRDEALALYGLDSATYAIATDAARRVERSMELHYLDGRHPTIEQVQDIVEMALAGSGNWAQARAYILYRARRAEKRLRSYDSNGLADYIALSKYARYRPELGRREVFPEAVGRVRDMHLTFFKDKLALRAPEQLPAELVELAGPNAEILTETVLGQDLESLIYTAFHNVAEKRVLPSMRSLQFGGDAILKNHARIYNCSFSNVDRVEFFREFFFLLLAGCGVGFSVQRHHVALLPALPKRAALDHLPIWHYEVTDTIEGWADAIHALFQSYYDQKEIEFSFAKIRPKGAPLKTTGGKAPGHRGLKRALIKAAEILDGASGRQLRPFEVYEICMHVAGAVLSGGIRRSATICLFSPDDEEMMFAKTGDWWAKAKHREASNNSAVLNRSEDNRAVLKKLFIAQKEFGEPGFYFSDHREAGSNPCVEIGLNPVIDWELSEAETANLYRYGYRGELPSLARLSGFQFCNLSTINAAAVKSTREFYRACINAAVIGTLQAAYTVTDYLSAVTRVINEHDALLGVSICGFMSNPELFFDQVMLKQGAHLCRVVNRIVAGMLSISPAARITCVKPEGTSSLLLGCASGIHPDHARRYFRRVRASRDESVFQALKAVNPQMTEVAASRGETDDIITFPVEAPENAILRKDISGVAFLELVKLVQQSWVRAGADPTNRNPDVSHNVSNTTTVKAADWDAVEAYIWENRACFTGIALLQDFGDKGYVQAPREEVVTEADIAKWNLLVPKVVDYTAMQESEDTTAVALTPACAGGSCDVV
jgi:ribonucleoside-diphosphate reductase alpha chain